MTRIAFLFPGQGSQQPGMGRDLCEHFAVARATFDEADAALGFALSRLSFDGPAEELQLTATEFRLLWTLARQPGRTYSRNELMDSSRGEDANALERTIDVHIRSLRRKLGTQADIIETVRGVGYRLKT